MWARRKPEQSPEPVRGRQPNLSPTTAPGPAAYATYRSKRSARLGETARLTPDEQIELRRAAGGPLAFIRRHWQHLAGAVLLIAALGVVLYISPQPKVVVTGRAADLALQKPEVYRQAAAELLAQPVNRNKVTIRTRDIEAKLRQDFPELAAVTVALPVIGTSPTLYVQPYEPKLLLIRQHGHIFVVDSTGRAIRDNADAALLEGLKLPVVNDNSTVKLEVGQKALPQLAVTTLDEIVAQLAAKDLSPSGIELPAGSSDMLVHLSGKVYAVRFSLRGQGREQAGAFLSVYDHFEQSHTQPREYVDVRLATKVYYK